MGAAKMEGLWLGPPKEKDEKATSHLASKVHAGLKVARYQGEVFPKSGESQSRAVVAMTLKSGKVFDLTLEWAA